LSGLSPIVWGSPWGAAMALSDAEMRTAFTTVYTGLSARGRGGSAIGCFPLRLPGGLDGVMNDSARRLEVSLGRTPDPMETANDFITACVMLGARAVANPSADDLVRLARFGW
jgi:hypothetical protein